MTQAWVAQIFETIKNGAFNYTAVYDDPTAITQDSDYTYVLPSIKLNYRITEDLRLRLGAAKTWPVPWSDPRAYKHHRKRILGEFTQIRP